MISSLYSGAASMEAYSRKQEVTASNLANIATPGYHRRFAVMMEADTPRTSLNADRAAYVQTRVELDLMPGSLYHTGDAMDLALQDNLGNEGNAFFSLRDEQGGEWYTRTLRLEVNERGTLLEASSGYPLMLPNGSEVRIAPGKGAISIDEEGRILQDNEQVGELDLTRFEDMNRLRPGPHGLLANPADNRAISARGMAKVMQGHREASNANAVDELVNMISSYRAYEATQKIVRQMSQSMQRLNQIATPA